jgi:predicted negative regulator of RcsB-dependent stress response
MKALPADIDAGFRTLKDRLGLDLKPHTNVIYVYADAGSDETQGRLVASTFVVGRDNKPAVVIRFHSEYVVAQPANYRKTIVHEMKHAGFEGLMGHSYDDLPQWIREGLAVWGSEDVDDRLRLVLCNQIVGGKDPLKVVNCIESPNHNEADYLEDALAFDWLESKKPGNVKAFCSRLVKGEPYRGIWADLAEKSYAEAMAEADAYCRRTVETALGEAYTTFRALYDAHRVSLKTGKAATAKWLEDGAKAALEKWIADHPDHPAGPFARFCLARLLITAGQHAEGRELLHRILKEDALRCALLDDAQLWIGVSYVSEKDAVNARAAFGVLLRDFSYSASARQVVGKYPAAGPVTR